MKLATLKNNTRDGQLVVVSKDLSQAIAVPDVAQTLQIALDNWQACQPLLETYYAELNAGKIKKTLSFHNQSIASPLPHD